MGGMRAHAHFPEDRNSRAILALLKVDTTHVEDLPRDELTLRILCSRMRLTEVARPTIPISSSAENETEKVR